MITTAGIFAVSENHIATSQAREPYRTAGFVVL